MLLLLLSLTEVVSNKHERFDVLKVSNFVYPVFIFLYCIAAFRYNMGYDYQNYIKIFKDASENKPDTIEKGFYLLNRFFSITTGSFYLLQIFISSFTCLILYKYIIKYSNFPILFYFLYFANGYFMMYDMTQIRQQLAVCIVLLGIIRSDFLKNRKKYFFYSFLACFFHLSGIIAFIIPFLGISLKKRTYILFSIACVFFSLFGKSIVITAFNFISLIIPKSFRLYYLFYGYINYYMNNKSKPFSIIGYLLKIFVFLFVVYFIKSSFKNTRENNIQLNSLLIVLIFTAISPFFPVLTRFNEYFNLIGFLAYEKLFISRKLKLFFINKELYDLFCLFFLLFFIMIFFNSYLAIEDVFVPYKIFLFEDLNI
jgi:hypothetical protein